MVTTPNRAEGQAAMEASLTSAEKVRRRLKAGRPRTAHSLPTHKALGLIISQADRARGLMREAGLDPNDVRLGLIRGADTLQITKLPLPGETAPFFDVVMSAVGDSIGILWEMTDREVPKGQPGITHWITPFVADRKTERQLLTLRAHIATSGTRLN